MEHGLDFTEKAVDALTRANKKAIEFDNATIEPVHLLLGIWEQDDTYLKTVIEKCGANQVEFERAATKVLIRVPTQNPPPDNVSLGSHTRSAITRAKKYMVEFGDSLIAVDTLILGLVTVDSVKNILKSANVKANDVVDTIKKLRGDRKVDSKSAEDQFDALNKYGVDMIKLVESGKLDPVIGRDEEIR
ncbi:Heat shock protein 104, partial [Smittium mucronatum]